MSFIPGTGNDPVFVSSAQSIVGAGVGNDWYYLSAAALASDATVKISDVLGSNTIQLPAGLTITGSRVAADLLELSLSNGAKVQVLGASSFEFVLGGAPLSSVGAQILSYSSFVTTALGSALPAAGEPVVVNQTGVIVNADGSTTGGGATYALTAGAASADEGTTATFELATTGLAAGTAVAYTLSGIDAADLASGALTGTATVDADGKATISVALAADAVTEGAETLTVTAGGATASTIVNDTSVAPVYALTASAASVDEGSSVTFTLALGQPNFTYSYELTGVDASDVVGGVLTGSITTDATGNASFTVGLANDRVSDGVDTLVATLPNTGLSASVTVNDTSVDNVAPVATAATGATTEAGAVVTGQLVATDAENDALTFEVTTAVEGLTINADGTYSFDPSLNTAAQALTYDAADLDIVANYTVTDALGATATSTLTITVTPKPLTLKLVPSAAFVEEGQSIEYKLVASEKVLADITAQVKVVPGDGTAGQTGANDFGSGQLNPQNVTILAGASESGPFNVIPQNDSATEVPESYTVVTTVTGFTVADVVGEVRDPSTVGGTGQTFSLTTSPDTIPGLVGSAGSTGTDGDDIIVGTLGTPGAGLPPVSTLSALDSINGGLGNNTLKISDISGGTALPGGLTITKIQTVEFASAGAATIDTSPWIGVTKLNLVTAAGATDLTAAATTDIKVDVAQAKAVAGLGTVVAVADVKADIAVKGGKDVTVNVTGVKQVLDVAADGSGELNGIVVGGATPATAVAAAGNVTVTTTGAVTAAAADAILSSITVTGGKTVSVTQKATSDGAAALTDTSAGGTTITQGAVKVTAKGGTTDITVKQDATVKKVQAVDAIAAKATTKEVLFTEAKSGDNVTVNFGVGTLQFTANKDLTAAEVASAFANLATNAKQGNAAASLGVYTDATGGVTNKWTSGAVQTVSATQSKVVFSSSDATANLTATAVQVGAGSTFTAADQTLVAGTNATPAKAGVLGVANGVVTIADDTTVATIKTITVDGYGNNAGDSVFSSITGTTVLDTLNLSNSAKTGTVGTGAKMTVAKAAATLALNLDKVGSIEIDPLTNAATVTTAEIDFTAAPSTLNVKSTGNNYVTLTNAAANIKTLNVSGTGQLSTSASGLGAVETIKVTETAGLDLGLGVVRTTVKSVDTTGTTGYVAVSIDQTASYAGGAGMDSVKVTGAIAAKSIDLGAGNDRLDLTAATFASIATTNVLEGGLGDDTLVLTAAQASATGGVSANNTFAARINGFEKLEVGHTAATATTVDMSNLDGINYVISAGSAAANTPALPAVVETTPGAVAVKEVQTITFGALLKGQVVTVAGLTLTADNDATAAQVAAAFAAGAATTGPVTGTGSLVVWAAPAVTAPGASSSTITGAANGDLPLVAPTTAGAASAKLTLDKMLTGATVEMKASSDVEVKLATDGTADIVNVVANAATGANNLNLTANKVETINVTANDTDSTKTAGVENVSNNTLTVAADNAGTINLKGAGNLTLTLAASSKEVTLIDGSTATGKLTVTTLAVDTAATTVKGGFAADTLTAGGTNDVLMGGDGKDTLKLGAAAVFSKLDGGAGIDSYVVKDVAMSQIGDYSQIVNLEKGETIQFKSGTSANFLATKFVLGGSVSFDSYATQALAKAVEFADANDGAGVLNIGKGGMAWFQFTNNVGATNTYIVQDNNGTAGFQTGDIVIEIVGAVDLSASSFNDVGQGTLLYI